MMGTIAQLALSIPRAGGGPDAAHFTRLLLQPREICRIERCFRWARVLAGTAWITCRGEDILVSAGERRELPESRECLLMSGIGTEPLAVELGG